MAVTQMLRGCVIHSANLVEAVDSQRVGQMTIIAVNAPGERVTKAADILGAVSELPAGQTVTILTHGYRYCPFTRDADPHRQLFSLKRRKSSWKAVSWAHYLRLGAEDAGLGIGFGWPALGRLDQAARRAGTAGRAMAGMIAEICAARPDLRIRIMAHSLGARVALEALRGSPAGSVETLLLLSAAEYRSAATRALATPAGQTARVINVTSRENLMFDALFRLFAPGRDMLSPALSTGLGQAPSRAGSIFEDRRPQSSGRLFAAHCATGLAQPSHRICHWSSHSSARVSFRFIAIFSGRGGAADLRPPGKRHCPKRSASTCALARSRCQVVRSAL